MQKNWSRRDFNIDCGLLTSFNNIPEFKPVIERIIKFRLKQTTDYPFIEVDEFKGVMEALKDKQVYPKQSDFISLSIIYQIIPESSSIWTIPFGSGCIAHLLFKEYSIYSNLTKEFHGWHLKNNKGLTVAHIAASFGKLPDDFNQWDIKDDRGTTVGTVTTMYLLLRNRF